MSVATADVADAPAAAARAASATPDAGDAAASAAGAAATRGTTGDAAASAARATATGRPAGDAAATTAGAATAGGAARSGAAAARCGRSHAGRRRGRRGRAAAARPFIAATAPDGEHEHGRTAEERDRSPGCRSHRSPQSPLAPRQLVHFSLPRHAPRQTGFDAGLQARKRRWPIHRDGPSVQARVRLALSENTTEASAWEPMAHLGLMGHRRAKSYPRTTVAMREFAASVIRNFLIRKLDTAFAS